MSEEYRDLIKRQNDIIQATEHQEKIVKDSQAIMENAMATLRVLNERSREIKEKLQKLQPEEQRDVTADA